MVRAAAQINLEDREFSFSQEDFSGLRRRIYDLTGIKLSDAKATMVYSRLVRRIRELQLPDFASYSAVLDGPDGDAELVNFVNALTTNLTRFFREQHHFHHLRHQLMQPLVAAARAGHTPARLRLWSAGCSTGQEPYSLAMTMAASIPARDSFDMRILATDIDTGVLARATEGVYGSAHKKDIPAALARRFMRDQGSDKIAVKPELAELVRFRHLNLQQDWPPFGPMDAIMCRNVMIYFDRATQARLVSRFIERLAPGGFLYVGHSESLIAETPGMKLVDRSTFRKDGSARWEVA